MSALCAACCYRMGAQGLGYYEDVRGKAGKEAVDSADAAGEKPPADDVND